MIIGADGATSVVAEGAGLIDHGAVLWGFAQRGYVEQEVDRPVIALWDEAPGQGFPGYGRLFPGLDGLANVGVGLGLGSVRSGAPRAVACFDEIVTHLTRLGLLGARCRRTAPGRLAQDGDRRHPPGSADACCSSAMRRGW